MRLELGRTKANLLVGHISFISNERSQGPIYPTGRQKVSQSDFENWSQTTLMSLFSFRTLGNLDPKRTAAGGYVCYLGALPESLHYAADSLCDADLVVGEEDLVVSFTSQEILI